MPEPQKEPKPNIARGLALEKADDNTGLLHKARPNGAGYF